MLFSGLNGVRRFAESLERPRERATVPHKDEETDVPVFLLAVSILLVHGLLIGFFPAQGQYLSLLMLTLLPATAGLSSLWRARAHGPLHEWRALSLGMALWSAAMAVHLVSTRYDAAWLDVASLALFVLYGVPLTFVLATPESGRSSERVIDGVLALGLGALFAVHTQAFATLPKSDPRGILSLQLLFDIENFYILLFSFIRWRSSRDPRLREFFWRLTQFSFVYFLTAFYINHLESESAGYGSYSDLLIDVPFLLLAASALRRGSHDDEVPEPNRRLVRIVAAVSPLVLPLSLLATSALLAGQHLRLAIVGFAFAIVGYGSRSVVTQVHSSETQEQLDELAHTDALTGVANRRRFDEEIRRQCRNAFQSGQNLSLLMIDIDHFKRLNDAMGHQMGDRRLREVAKELAALSRRSGDLVARYGGEEFAVILRTASGEAAAQFAERLRSGIERLRLDAPPPASNVTISVGVSCLHPAMKGEPAALIADADACLYEAKRRGRNCVAFGSQIVGGLTPPVFKQLG
ncbi:GGDEF domain-containing protein [Hydrocarboniphaga effusa]|uniref:GGDEF domain-containing protein n=1 Tax=Hydrocarboniphaga effusa TaxID=243629 RepID=UPI0009FF4EDD|nr:GGDEF domain-containing protein [Hydrocarboniphaga effusa]